MLGQIDWKKHLKEWKGSLVLLPLCIYFTATWGTYTLIDSADLIIHEAGHVFFGIFGPFIRIAGGTLMQLVLPSILIWHFFVHRYCFGTQVSLFWLGHNMLNISVYAADARSRRLPLLGGDISRHDWWNMLGMLDLLAYDQIISGIFIGGAMLAFLILLALPRLAMQ